MKISKTKLKQIIKEEIDKLLNEDWAGALGDLGSGLEDLPTNFPKTPAPVQLGDWNPLSLAGDIQVFFQEKWYTYVQRVTQRSAKECVKLAMSWPPYKVDQACVRQVAIQEAGKAIYNLPSDALEAVEKKLRVLQIPAPAPTKRAPKRRR